MLKDSALLKPVWPAPAHVKAVFTTRAGGVSVAPFDTLNLGDHVHDESAHVARNRALLAQHIQARPVFLQQVHGTDVALIDVQSPDGTAADACITLQPGLACTIMVADCLPLLLTDRAGSFVAAAHAGWRGLAGQGGMGVVEQIHKEIVRFAQQRRAREATKLIAPDILVWLGPCIGPAQFEVGPEVKAAFEASQPGAARHFQRAVAVSSESGVAMRPVKYFANLQGLARDRLQALGMTQIFGNDGSAVWCTVSNAAQFFSHRRDAVRQGSTGRMAACVWLTS